MTGRAPPPHFGGRLSLSGCPLPENRLHIVSHNAAGQITMDGDLSRLSMFGLRPIPGAAFGEDALPARLLDPGMGLAVARRTVFRPEDAECFGRVADRVAAGNIALLGRHDPATRIEQARLRNAIATGALLTSGRHLQHGDAEQPTRNMEVFTNCATAASSFAKFYLLLNGSGVGRSYDDALMAVDWTNAPDLLLYLSSTHPDHPAESRAGTRFATEMGIGPDEVEAFLARELLPAANAAPAEFGLLPHRQTAAKAGPRRWNSSRSMAFRGERDRALVLDLSAIRPAGSPIRGMQGRPASGPVSLLRAFINIRRHVIEPARRRDPAGETMQPWEQACCSTTSCRSRCRSAAPAAPRGWRPSPGATRACCASSG